MTAGRVLCFGEVLWDSVPLGLLPGGAPMNLAYHLSQLGANTSVLSAVGNDTLGEEILGRLNSWGIDTSMVQIDTTRPTGIVRVKLVRGMPSYDIVEGVAWDVTAIPDATPTDIDTLVFGSLAQRTAENRASLDTLLARYPTAFTVFDVNLRKPYIDLPRIEQLASAASLVKVNDEELSLLLGREVAEENDALRDAALALAARYGLKMVCVTAGASGAGLLENGQWHWSSATPVAVRDTIGAGDAFLSAVVFGLRFRNQSHEATLAFANRLAGLVAASNGATPAYQLNDDGLPVVVD